MNRIWLISVIGMLASTGSGQDLRAMLRKAAGVSGPEYIATRNQIIEIGERVVPMLEAVLADESIDWRERAMAGIVIEHIVKGDRIHALINYDWSNHPDLKDHPGWQTRAGRPPGFYKVLANELEEVDLNYYFLELAWKETGESPRVGTSGGIGGNVQAEEVDNPFLINVAREKVANIPYILGAPWIDSNWYYGYLLRIQDRESLPHLFDLWLNYMPVFRDRHLRRHREGNPHRSEEDIQRFTDRDTDRMLRPLLEAAGLEDEAWILEKLNGVALGEDGQRYLARYQRRCRGLPEREPIDETQMGESQRKYREMLRRRAAERAQQEQSSDPESHDDDEQPRPRPDE